MTTWHEARDQAQDGTCGISPLADTLIAILDIHQPMPGQRGVTVCAHCLDLVGDHTPWPCQTATACGVTK